MSRWAKLFGLGANPQELDVRALAPEGAEVRVREVLVDEIQGGAVDPDEERNEVK